MRIYFDDSLPELVSTILSHCGDEDLLAGIAVRDTSGRLAFYFARPLDEAETERLTVTLSTSLGVYARDDRVVAGTNTYGIAELFKSPDIISVKVKGHIIRLIDRRIIGADWLRTPKGGEAGKTPRFVFASLKGGVGRSTALAIVAAHAASRGLRVLAVDLDIEAPGLGAMLLSREITPRFGMIDALVERVLAPLPPEMVQDLVGASTLTSRGRIDVLPAFGSRSLQNSGDILAKLGRAYGEVIREDGRVETTLDQVASIIDAVQNYSRYDLVLIDSRAGLHEIAAAALFGLGAEIFCFGIDEPQTFQGYGALFGHINRYSRGEAVNGDWYSRVTIVQAKAPIDAQQREDFQAGVDRLFKSEQANEAIQDVPLLDDFSDIPWDDTISDTELGLTDIGGVPGVLGVLFDPAFANFDPLRKRDQLSEAAYQKAFGGLLEYVDQALARRNEGSR